MGTVSSVRPSKQLLLLGVLCGMTLGSRMSADEKPTRPLLDLIVQTGHTGAITSVAFSPDGNHVLTGSGDGTAALWEVEKGTKLRGFHGFSGKSTFSPDGKQVLSGSVDKTAVLWDAITGRKLRSYSGHSEEVIFAAFSSDGKRILTGSWDKTALLWDAATGEKLRSLPGSPVSFAPDGKQVLTGSEDRTAILWDAATGRKLQRFMGHSDRLSALAFSPDGKHILTWSRDDSGILWDAATGQKLHAFEHHKWHVNAVAFSPDGKRVVTGSSYGSVFEQAAVLWDVASGKKIRTFQANTRSVNSVAFSPDGKRILTGIEEHAAIMWDPDTGKKIRAFEGRSSPVNSLACSPDGKRLLTGSNDHAAVLWDPLAGSNPIVLQAHSESVNSVVFRADGKQALSGSHDGTVVLWNGITGQKIRLFQGHTYVNSVAFAPDGKRVLTGGDKFAVIWDSETGQKLQTLRHVNIVRAVAFSHDGKQVLTGTAWGDDENQAGLLWDAFSGKPARRFEGHSASITCVSFSPGDKTLSTGSSDGTITLWDTARGTRLRDFKLQGAVESVAFNPDGRFLLAGCANGTAVCWDAIDGHEVRTFHGHTAAVLSASFSHSGKLILTGSSDGSTRLWEKATGRELCRLVGIDKGTHWLVVTPEGLFDGSKRGREQSFFRVGNGLDVVPVDHFFQDGYYPGLLAALWRGERPMPGQQFEPSPAPSIKILVNRDGVAQPNQVALDIALTDKGGGVKGPWLSHNGAALKGSKLLVQEGKVSRHRIMATLVSGNNHIEVRAASRNGAVESEPAVTLVTFDGKLPAPDLYVIAVGINRFAKEAGENLSLEFCVPDAKAIADMFHQRSDKLYGKVHVTTLFDEQASKANILKAVTDLTTKARPQDTLVFFVASHGYTVGQRFYLFPHDFRVASAKAAPEPDNIVAMRGYRGRAEQEAGIREHALAIDELGEALSGVPALKRVLIFDTCQSGSAVALAGKKQDPFAFRGAMERFSRAQGVYCLSATRSDELAAETKELGHSILTYTLLAGAGVADRGPLIGKPLKTEKPALDVLDWFRFARGEVPGLYLKYVGRAQSVDLSGEDQRGFRC